MKIATLALLGVCIALSLAELGLRAVSPPWEIAVPDPFAWVVLDPVVGWKNHAHYRRDAFSINGLSFRGPEISTRKPATNLRIVCLGDSRTFGIWNDLHQTRFDNDYPAALATLIHQDAALANVEVINAGVIGYSSAHGLRQLMTQILDLQPDVIIVGFGFDDHAPAWSLALRAREPRVPAARALLYGLHDLRIMQLALAADHEIIARLYPATGTVPWADLEDYDYNLRRFVTVSHERGIHLLFLTQALRPIELGDSLPAFPERGSDTNPYPGWGAPDLASLHQVEKSYQEVLYRVASETGVPLADAANVFAHHQGEPLFGMYDLVHPNVAGAQLIATIINEKLRDLGWLRPRVQKRRSAAR